VGAWFHEVFIAEVEALPLRMFECLFTVTFLIWMRRCFLTWEEWLTEAGFHLTKEELASMGYPEPWPLLEAWQVPFFGGLILLGGGLLLWPMGMGFGRASQLAPLLRRAGLVLLFATALYAQRVDYMAAFTLNKLYVGIYAVLMVAPGMWRNQETGRLMVSAAPLRVLQATLILQYFAAGGAGAVVCDGAVCATSGLHGGVHAEQAVCGDLCGADGGAGDVARSGNGSADGERSAVTGAASHADFAVFCSGSGQGEC
jgi:hypothetical protein